MVNFILKCEQYRKNKHDIYKAYGAPQKIELIIKAWQLLIINYIIKLPKLKNPITEIIYNNI